MVLRGVEGVHERSRRRRGYFLAACLAALAMAPAAASGAQASSGHRVPASEEAIVIVSAAGAAMATGDVRARLRGAVDDAGLELERSLPEIGIGSVDLPPGETIAELRRELAGEPGVVAVEPNERLELRAAPNDPAYGSPDPEAPGGDIYQWNLRKSGFVPAWGRSTGANATVAVIDTGAEADHPDLGPRIKDSFDHDGTPLAGPAGTDEDGHGSHVSGLACGEAGNGYGIAGAGYRCQLLIYKSDLTHASISESIVDAADRGADVINMSFGGDGRSQAIERAVSHAVERDVVLVAAASNDDVTDQGIPAEYLQPQGSGSDISRGDGLVVTAAQYDGSRAYFEPGHGTGISLAAYGAAGREGRGIFSSFPAGTTAIETTSLCLFCRANFQGDSRFAYLEGTSMATPQVAGASALIRSRRPGMRAARVIRLLKLKADRSGGFSDELGWGVLDANAAIRATLKRKKKKR